MSLRFVAGGLDDPQIVAMLRDHVAAAHANSPPGETFVLDVSHLRDPAIRFWSVWEGDALAGMGALKLLEPGHAEIKSMRVAASHQRRGIGAAIVTHLLDEARSMGLARVSLETGSNQAFAAARALYERAGFAPCERFGDYPGGDFSRYYTLKL
ncbi:MAG: GNAT family N-acetyltransferase [Pseudomonadota bacterium]